MELYKSNGTIANSYSYAPFGEVTQRSNITNPLQWSSEMFDAESGLVYYNYRHYNPYDGRWTSRDPIGIQGGYNLYTFVNNAVNKKDKNGLGFNLPVPHPEFPTPTGNGGNVWPNGEYSPPGVPLSIPLTPDELASIFCNYSIPAPKCTCPNSSKVLDPYQSGQNPYALIF